jgi:formate/nitrite transporter FocA (FNT family)
MLNARVFTLGVLTDCHNVYIIIKGLIPFQWSTWSHICVQIEFPAEKRNMTLQLGTTCILCHINICYCVMIMPVKPGATSTFFVISSCTIIMPVQLGTTHILNSMSNCWQLLNDNSCRINECINK